MDLDTCKEQLLQAVDLYENTTLVLDALDECEPKSRHQFMDTIEFLCSNSSKPIKVFISSRHEPDIQERLFKKPTIEIEARHNEEDIQKFVKSQLKRRWNMTQEFEKDMTYFLFKHSEGM
jgi:ankyrin repeat domain-containing protein 50